MQVESLNKTTSAITGTPGKDPAARFKHLAGLNGIRFVLAAFVVIHHLVPHLDGEVLSHGAGRYVRLIINNAFNGTAAVIGFFVVSGLCIHYPNRDRASLPLLPFYVRREVRILVPLAAMLVFSKVLSVRMTTFQDSILWSLVCEEIYYLIYPLLLRIFRRVGVAPTVIASYVVAYAVVIVRPSDGNYMSFGIGLTWLVGLPCWLLGCLIAEQLGQDRAALPPSHRAVWVMRLSVFVSSVGLSMLRWHSPLTYPWTLNLFAILCFFWLRMELRFYDTRKPWALLERLGLGSYSLYLVHMHTLAFWRLFGISDGTYLQLPFSFACAYVFYRLIEAPSHRLARRAYGWMAKDVSRDVLAEKRFEGSSPAP